MNSERLTKIIVDHFGKNLKTNVRLFIEANKDLAEINIAEEVI